jgi:hypothetical protein
MTGPTLTVEAAAIRIGEAVFTLPRPNRHHNVMWWLHVLGISSGQMHAQGFVLSDGSYAGRHRAFEIAELSGQIIGSPPVPGTLFSEDLWEGGADLPSMEAIKALAGGQSFQTRIKPWMRECFGDVIPFDKVERGDRFVEEVYELLQWAGYDRRRLRSLEYYVWDRPVGEGPQEVGGVMVTLAAFCLAHGLDMHAAGETELARIWTKVEQIRAKQAAKPTGSALPITTP